MKNGSCQNCEKLEFCSLHTKFHDLGLTKNFKNFFQDGNLQNSWSLHEKIERLIADNCMYYEYTDKHDVKENS